MTVKKTQLIAPKAPRLPSPRDEYSAETLDQLNNSLKTYFNQIDTTQSTLLGPVGARFLDFPYGIIISNVSNGFPLAGTVYIMPFTTLVEGTGIGFVPATSTTRVALGYPGLWGFEYTAQFNNSDTVGRDVTIWLAKNGVAIPNTAQIITLPVGKSAYSFNRTISCEQDDYMELYLKPTTASVISTVYTAAAGSVPAVPSASVTVNFMSAINSSSTDIPVVPPAPPAPSPSPSPSPTPAPGPAPPPPAPAPAPGQDTDVQAIFTALGAGSRAWWYPAYANDRIQNGDGTGTVGWTDTTHPYYRQKDHSGNGFHMNWAADGVNLYLSPRAAMGQWNEPATVALGGSTTGFTAAFAVRFDSGSYNTIFSNVTTAATSSTAGTFLRFDNGTLTFSVGNGTTRVSVSQSGLIDGASAQNYVILVWYDNTAHTINLKVNDLTLVSAACSSLSVGSSAMSLFANPFADFSLGGWEGWDHFYGLVYGGLIFKNTTLGSTDRDTLRYWLGTQAGVTLSGSGSTPTPPPPPPAPPPPPPPAPGPAPSITTAVHRHDLLKIGNFYIEDNRWNAANAGIPEGTNAWEFRQSVERYTTLGSNGEVAFKVDWYWPRYRQNGTEYDHPNFEVKSFPCAIYGAKPGYAALGGSPAYPAGDFAVRLPDGVTVASAPGGAPSSVAADWQPLGGSVSSATPSGSSGGVLPLTLPITQLKAQFKYDFTNGTPPNGRGHLSFDMWLQDNSTQLNGFRNSPVTHEIMVPIVNWGNYGNPHTALVPDRDGANFIEDVTIGGITYKFYAWQNKGTNPVTGNFDGGSYPGVQYNFPPSGGTTPLNGAFTNEETGSGRIAWKFLVFIPTTFTTIAHPVDANGYVNVDIAGILNYLMNKRDSRNIPMVRSTSVLVDVELGYENVYSQGSMTVYNYNVTGSALPPPPPPPPPAPPPAPAPGTSPYYPFGSRLDNNSVTGAYPFGIMPNNYTKAQMDARVISGYEKWKAARLKSCPTFVANSGAGSGLAGVTITNGLYDDFGGSGYVSEGMGYALLILVLMAGYDPNAQNLFDRVFKVCRARPAYGLGGTNGRDMMDWKVGPGMDSQGGGYSAMDGDEDMALALLMAERQWGNAGTFNYGTEATNTITALKNIWLSGSGTPRYASQNAARTSDFMPGHFRSYKWKTGAAIWDSARTRSATLTTNIISGFSPVAKLQPGFIYDPDGTPVPAYPGHGQVDGTGYEGTYDANAIRNPWRFVTDYIWTGDATWGNFASGITSWIKSSSGGDPFQTWGQYNLDGSGYAGRYLSGVTAVCAGTGGMSNAAHQTYLNTMFTVISDNFDSSYYNAEIETICLIVMSGNWWRPEGP